MIWELQRGFVTVLPRKSGYWNCGVCRKDKLAWECDHDGQLWGATPLQLETQTVTMPITLCLANFHSIFTAFTVSLLADLAFQVYIYSLNFSTLVIKCNWCLDVHALPELALLETTTALFTIQRSYDGRYVGRFLFCLVVATRTLHRSLFSKLVLFTADIKFSPFGPDMDRTFSTFTKQHYINKSANPLFRLLQSLLIETPVITPLLQNVVSFPFFCSRPSFRTFGHHKRYLLEFSTQW